MKKYAFIENGEVRSVIEGKDDATRDWESYYGGLKGMSCVAIPDTESVGIGFKYENNTFVNPTPIISETEQLEQWRNSFSTDLYKIKIELDNMGDLDAVDAIIATQPKRVQIAWKTANTVRRNSPTVAGLALAMSYTDEVLAVSYTH